MNTSLAAPATPAPASDKTRGGFTLVELLVVVAVVAVMAGLLVPALLRARATATGMACLNHQRQLGLAWLLYAGDFQETLPQNFGESDTRRTVADSRFLNWANNVLNWELDPLNTNTAALVAGGLGPYARGAVEIFRCPSDRVLSDLQRGAGWKLRVRSISMNAMVGDAGEFTSSGRNVNNPYHRQFFRQSQIPEPARIFVFIEEHPDSVNDGYFLNKPAGYEWIDLPASWHNGGANLVFADGHAESHRWRSASTRRPARPDGAQLPFAVGPEDDGDFDWLMERTTVLRSAYPTRTP